VRTQQAGNGLADAVVIYELWRFAVTLVVPSGMYKWSVNPLPIQPPSTRIVTSVIRDNKLNIYMFVFFHKRDTL
jgi:hypothetical protein